MKGDGRLAGIGGRGDGTVPHNEVSFLDRNLGENHNLFSIYLLFCMKDGYKWKMSNRRLRLGTKSR